MDLIIFRIEESKKQQYVGRIKARIFRVAFIVYALITLIISLAGILEGLIAAVVVQLIIMTGLGAFLWVIFSKRIEAVGNLQIQLSKEGVTRIAEHELVVSIPWENLAIERSTADKMILVNKRNSFSEKATRIPVPNELENYDKFCDLINQMKPDG